MNILVSKAAPPGALPAAGAAAVTAGAHQDNTIVVYLRDNPWPAFAHETDVLYAQVCARAYVFLFVCVCMCVGGTCARVCRWLI